MLDQARFLKGFLRSPREVGSIIPSSRFLERRIRRTIDVAQAPVVVELGPGTGGTTQAVLADMPADATLLAIDTNPAFIKRLQAIYDPRLIAQQDSAESLAALIRGHELAAPSVIFSGIPFSTMPAASANAIIDHIWAALAPGGRFMAYQFRPDVARYGNLRFGAPLCEREWLNIPPMWFFVWDKPTTAPSTRADISAAPAAAPVPAAAQQGNRAQSE